MDNKPIKKKFMALVIIYVCVFTSMNGGNNHGEIPGFFSNFFNQEAE